MPKPIQIQGKDYYLNLSIIRGSAASGDVNIVLELYDEEPTFTNGDVSVEPVHSFTALVTPPRSTTSSKRHSTSSTRPARRKSRLSAPG
jgi:hypothetical protein